MITQMNTSPAENYKEIFNCITDIFFILDQNLNVTFWNKTAALSGISEETALKSNLIDLFPDLKGSGTEKALLNILEKQEKRSFEQEYLMKGILRYYKVDAYPCSGGIAVLGKDITEYKELESINVRTKERYQRTLDSMMEGCAMLDYDFRYIYVNEAHTRHARFSKGELIGKKITELFSGIETTTFFKIFKNVLEKRLPHQLVTEYVYPDNLRRWFDLKIAPVPEGIFVLSEDVTNRIKYEQSLVHYKSILEQSERLAHAGTWWFNIEENTENEGNIIIHWSDEVYRIFGYEPGDMKVNADFFFSHVHPEDRESVYREAVRSREEGSTFSCEYRIIRPDGMERILKQNGELNYDQSGKTVRMVGAVVDITDFRETEKTRELLTLRIEKERDKLKHALKEKETLLRELYHRTKNNLQVISSLLSLRADSLNDRTLAGILHEMQYRIKTISLVHEKLYQTQNLTKVDLSDYITGLLSLLQDSYSNSSENIRIKTDLEPVEVTLDTAIPCGLIVNELVSNCYKHAFPEGKTGIITIILRKEEDGAIVLIISDNGVGMPVNNLKDTSSFGMNLFKIIAEDQLQAEVTSDFTNGVEWRIRFKS